MTRAARRGPRWALAPAAALAALALAQAGCPPRRPAALAEPLSVEQPGGTVSQLVAQGSELPTSATESFTTSRDGETALLLHLLRGAGHAASGLSSDGFWMVEEVAADRAGVPLVLVTFELDARAQVSVSAREGARRLPVRRLAAPPPGTPPARLSEPDEPDDSGDELQ